MQNDAHNNELKLLLSEVEALRAENELLKRRLGDIKEAKTTFVPKEFEPIFDVAEDKVAEYFKDLSISPKDGEIVIHGERYVLMRSASLSFEFFDLIRELYKTYSDEEAKRIGNNFLFDIAQVLGKKDAKAFQKKMNLEHPVEKLSAGPPHFAYTGWANVEVLPESNPTPDENYFLKYHHHNSFEAQSYLKAKKKTDSPVCIMNSGYSSGWCEESFGIPLTAVEISCEAMGDEHCTFIMAPPNKIADYLPASQLSDEIKKYDIPIFFNRKISEEKLKSSLLQKETLLKEVHHRVKNNLQIISSLFNLQMNSIDDEKVKEIFRTSLNRVNTMSLVHELFYSEKNLSAVDIKSYFRRVVKSLLSLYYNDPNEVDLEMNFNIIQDKFNPDLSIPLGLILNEMTSNAFKYAIPVNKKIIIELTEEDGLYEFKFQDFGPGLKSKNEDETLGMLLIKILCEQIDAQLKVISSTEGLTYLIKFKP